MSNYFGLGKPVKRMARKYLSIRLLRKRVQFLNFYRSHPNLYSKFAANYSWNNLVGFVELLRKISVTLTLELQRRRRGVQRVANENKVH